MSGGNLYYIPRAWVKYSLQLNTVTPAFILTQAQKTKERQQCFPSYENLYHPVLCNPAHKMETSANSQTLSMTVSKS